MDTGGDQRTRKLDENPISQSPFKGDAWEFTEKSRMLLKTLRSNPEFTALPQNEQRLLLAELMEGNKDLCGLKEDDLPIRLKEGKNKVEASILPEGNDSWKENNDAAERHDQESRNPCIGQACGDTLIKWSQELLEVLQRNPEFAVLPQSEQWLVLAELLENEHLLAQSGEGGCNDATKTLTGDSLLRQENTSILPEGGLHPEGTDKQQWLLELGTNDRWADKPEDDTSPETADYWIQLIRNLTREKSNELLDDLLRGTTNDLPDDDFDDSTWGEVAIQLPNNSFTQEEAIHLVQNNNEGAHPANDLGSISSLQGPTSTQSDASPACLTAPTVTPSQEQSAKGTSTTNGKRLRPLHNLQQYGENLNERHKVQKVQYENVDK
ncbi:hypothetical protein H4582DRAFT_2062581 [Lactarius indigo]|nr:hypothetical protein H4582DRAFT_2062581 [Lactarius indigo]